jgi:hypothetical protein
VFEPTGSRRDAFLEAVAKAILDASDEQYAQDDHLLVLRHSHRYGLTTAADHKQRWWRRPASCSPVSANTAISV